MLYAAKKLFYLEGLYMAWRKTLLFDAATVGGLFLSEAFLWVTV